MAIDKTIMAEATAILSCIEVLAETNNLRDFQNVLRPKSGMAMAKAVLASSPNICSRLRQQVERALEAYENINAQCCLYRAQLLAEGYYSRKEVIEKVNSMVHENMAQWSENIDKIVWFA